MSDKLPTTAWNRECVVCGYRWLGLEVDECPWEHFHNKKEPRVPSRELVRRLRDPSGKMLDAMAKALSPGVRPTDEYVSVREKHRIRFIAAVEQLLEEIGWPK